MAKGIKIARYHMELEERKGTWYGYILDKDGKRPYSRPTSAIPGSGGTPMSSHAINLWKDLVEEREKTAKLESKIKVLEARINSLNNLLDKLRER